jgi:hypothetical protein
LNGSEGALALEPIPGDAGVEGVFTADGTSFGNPFGLVPGAPDSPIEVETLIGVSCNVADLNGDAGFCLAGSGEADIDGGGPVLVGFISSVSTVGATPTISNTQFLGTYPANPVYLGLTALPNQVAVSAGTQGSMAGVNYWELSDLSTAPGALGFLNASLCLAPRLHALLIGPVEVLELVIPGELGDRLIGVARRRM